jgi:hypothetical protein
MAKELTLESPYTVTLEEHEEELLTDYILRNVGNHVEAGKTTWSVSSLQSRRIHRIQIINVN